MHLWQYVRSHYGIQGRVEAFHFKGSIAAGKNQLILPNLQRRQYLSAVAGNENHIED